MNYEKKYKEALERAKKLYEQGTITESLGYVFPELKGNKDERIRKAIKKALQVRCDGSRIISDEPVTLEEAIAWLEKQGENKKLDADKVIEWLKPYSVIVDNIIDEFKKDFRL